MAISLDFPIVPFFVLLHIRLIITKTKEKRGWMKDKE